MQIQKLGTVFLAILLPAIIAAGTMKIPGGMIVDYQVSYLASVYTYDDLLIYI